MFRILLHPLKVYKDNIYLFLCGFIPSSVKTYLLIERTSPFVNLLLKILTTLILGFFGGIAGVLAKKFMKWIGGVVLRWWRRYIS